MDSRFDGHARGTAGLAPGVRACSRLPMNHAKVLLCVLLAISLSFVPLGGHVNSGHVTIQKSEAHANPAVVAGAGAAISALALELGISEGALIAGICAVGVGATGLAFYNASRTDVALPGWTPWDDLTPQQKQDWVGQDGTSEDYYNQQIAWWALQAGILEQTPNGDLQPTPEPDPDNDPDEHSNWQKARNVLIALAAGGGSVAFNDAVGPLVDNAAASIKEMLFGGSNVPLGSLELNYQGDYVVSGNVDRAVRFVTAPGNTLSLNNGHDLYVYRSDTWWSIEDVPNTSGHRVCFKNQDYTAYTFNFRETSSSGVNYFTASSPQGVSLAEYDSSGAFVSVSYASSRSINVPNTSGNNTWFTYLNANYNGTYNFGSSAAYSNGQMTGNFSNANVNYGQMSDTPTGLEQNILNQTNLVNFFNSYTNDTPSDYKRALTVPVNFNDPNYTPQYSDFVKVTPDEDITTIPGNEQLPGPGSDNPPTPTPDQLYREDFGEEVARLLAQPFDQLFPFCLIGDLHRLTEKVEGALYGEDSLNTQDITITNGTSEYVIPLDDFGIEGIEDITFDLTPILQFGNMVRPWTTSLFIILLLVGTFRFFLYRGGE